MPFAVILAVGIDSQLLETRRLVLQAAGYVVVPAQSAKDAVNRFLAGDFDLVLVCHSVPERDRDRLACLIRATGSLTPIVTVARYGGQHDVFATATIESEPQQLLTGISDVLTKQHQKMVTERFSSMRQNNMHRSGS